MIDAVAFQTKARTVDHLGREQIADTPTAISELWKNAYDAYARNVALDIYDGPAPLAIISDDGHGMSRREFETRWLVVGTESKATNAATPLADRNGLMLRPRQGQKGIGRLSAANLGPLLVFVSKRKRENYVAALIDWRLFENPYLNLSDIRIPVVDFEHPTALAPLLPQLRHSLAANINGSPEDLIRTRRLRDAWALADELHGQAGNEQSPMDRRAPSHAILEDVSALQVDLDRLNIWPVWTGKAEQGTALLISGLNYDLLAQIGRVEDDSSAKGARRRFFETLTGFADPFTDPLAPEVTKRTDFEYAVRTWTADSYRLVVSPDKQYNRRVLDGMEHIIHGEITADGAFIGKVKAFGRWIPDSCTIPPPKDLVIPHRTDTMLGPLSIYIASMEFEAKNTTLPKMEFQRFKQLAEEYAGFMIYRDGLRVLPYGREDNDFFEIESRRSKSAGREFWNHRQMFGRLAITREENPNLKDKAGREGLLDNRAAKTLKELVSHILKQSARLYFGSASEIRGEVLPQVRANYAAEKASESRNRLRQKQRKEFRSKLKGFSAELPAFRAEVKSFAANLQLSTETDVADAQHSLEHFRDRLSDFRLTGAPKNLGTLEDAYSDYRDAMRAIADTNTAIAEKIEISIAQINPAQPRELLEKQIARHGAQLSARVQAWRRSIEELQRSEASRIRDLVASRNKTFHAEAHPLLARFDRGELSYVETSKALENLKADVDHQNGDLFVPYLRALESLKESIDLEGLAAFGMDELGELRAELERLNALAQLGIAVEIVGHELQAYDDIIAAALNRLPADIRTIPEMSDIEFGFDGLTDQLRFLSPLRLAGQRIERWISGDDIAKYIEKFFGVLLAKNHIVLDCTERFRSFRVFDQQSRLLPVFINLINNSLYWVSTVGDHRIIRIDVVGIEVVIADTGPGVDPEDVASLFSLFFTKKARGGRGVGLYLSKANLSASGHRIRYLTDNKLLRGANFAIDFRGGEFDAG